LALSIVLITALLITRFIALMIMLITALLIGAHL